MTIETPYIDVMPVLRDAKVDLNLIETIEVAPLPDGGIELVDYCNEQMIESDWQMHNIYLCQSETGYFCDLQDVDAPGRIGRTGEVLMLGPEEVLVSPQAFLSEGLPEDEVIVVICHYAEEQYTGRVDYGYRITIYTPQPQNEMSQKERESKIEALGLWGVVGEIEISDQELDELLEKQNNRIVNYNSITEEQLEKEMEKGTPSAREAWLNFLKDDLGEEEFETYILENDLA